MNYDSPQKALAVVFLLLLMIGAILYIMSIFVGEYNIVEIAIVPLVMPLALLLFLWTIISVFKQYSKRDLAILGSLLLMCIITIIFGIIRVNIFDPAINGTLYFVVILVSLFFIPSLVSILGVFLATSQISNQQRIISYIALFSICILAIILTINPLLLPLPSWHPNYSM